MTHYTAMIKIDDIWRYLLIVISEDYIVWDNLKEIKFNVDDIEIIYYTEGLYKEFNKENQYIFWFLFNQKNILINGESDELADLRKANDILMGVES